MSAAIVRRQYDVSRLVAMWVCLILFLARVLGQVEALLIEPAWLPPMKSWYSGLLPYPLLLPIQVVLLMFMTALTWHQTATRQVEYTASTWKRVVHAFAVVYFFAMAMRLVVQCMRGAPDIVAAGGIPIAFHWILALFLLLNARSSGVHVLPAKILGQSFANKIDKVVAIKPLNGFRRRSAKGVIKSL